MANFTSNGDLSARIAISFAVFAIIGSVALVWRMLKRDQRESALPKSAKLAASLSEILKMRVAFRSADQFVTAPGQMFDRASLSVLAWLPRARTGPFREISSAR